MDTTTTTALVPTTLQRVRMVATLVLAAFNFVFFIITSTEDGPSLLFPDRNGFWDTVLRVFIFVAVVYAIARPRKTSSLILVALGALYYIISYLL